MKKNDQRDYLLDNYKTLLIFLIVIGHFIEQSYDSNIFIQYLKLGIYAFHVPAFVFLSGYFSKKNYLISDMVGKLLIPFFVYEVIYYLFYTYFLQVETELYIIYPKFSLWYLWCLFFWRIIAPRFKQSALWYALTIAAGLLIGFVPLDNLLSLPRMIFFFPFFLAGRWITSEQIAVFRRKKHRIFCISILVLTFGLLFLSDYFIGILPKLFYGRYDYKFLEQSIAVGMLCRLVCYLTAFIITLVLIGSLSAKRRVWTYIGERTMAIYIFHGLVYNFLKEKTTLIDDLASPTATILLLAGCIGLVFLFSLPPFTGITVFISSIWGRLTDWMKARKKIKMEDMNMNFNYGINQIAYYDENDKLIAEVTFPDVDDHTVNIDRTFVDESLRGQGVAGKLMEAAAGQLRTQKKKALLTCSYAQKWFGRHPEYNDVVKEVADRGKDEAGR